MILKDVKIRSFAVVLCFTAPLASAEIQQVRGGLSSGAAADLLFQLEALQQEVQHLRGQLEEQGHALKIMKQSQRDRYIDLDKRMSLLMSSSISQSTPSVTTNPQIQQSLNLESLVVVKESGVPNTLVPPLSPVTLQPPSQQSQQAYNNAYNLIRERKFDESEVVFSQFVQDYPNNSLTGNGYYWLGEVKLVQGKSKEAIDAFSTVVNKFPGHSKEQDALYKLGTVSDQLGDTTKAKYYLQDVIKRFPGSKAAKLATGYLSKVR